MKEKTGKPITFRPRQELRQRLEKAQSVGIEMTDVINDLLMTPYEDGQLLIDRYLEFRFEQKRDQLRFLMKPSVPA